MSNTLDAIHLLQDKLESLFFNYEFLKKENDILLKSTTVLQQKLVEKEQALEIQKKEYDLLKIAKTIEGSSDNTRDTKLL